MPRLKPLPEVSVKRRKAPFENSVHFGYGDAVIDHRHACGGGALGADVHLRGGEHTAPAVDYEAEIAQIVGKTAAGAEGEFGLVLRIFAYPRRQFDGAYVPALAVMGAAFGNEHAVAVLQVLQELRALRLGAKLSAIPCHQY